MTIVLRLENAALLVLGMTGYQLAGGNWWLFALLFLVPDVSMAAYLAGPKTGAIGYNIVHSWIGPALFLAGAFLLHREVAVWVGLIWSCHVAFDRALGFGLKRLSGFHDTHLGRIGKAAPAEPESSR
ncbi:MAG: DUF4260 domain-containing protein [Salaquimonas sp.]|nr:DUF4260 domain-containing protein [Salaquimonas sp.]